MQILQYCRVTIIIYFKQVLNQHLQVINKLKANYYIMIFEK
jgi:hypothetical protein